MISKTNTEWYRVNDQPCIHTIVRGYNVNLCKWFNGRTNIISIDVDNLNTNRQDIINDRFEEGCVEYNSILPIYTKALNESSIPSYMV